jgi:hypothetical protein
MKHILLFLLLTISSLCKSQVSVSPGTDGDRIVEACNILKQYSPEIYNTIVQRSNIRSYLRNDGEKLASTNKIQNGTYWILIGIGSLRDRSILRLAGVIYHEALHILIADERIKRGESGYFTSLSQKRQKQEELYVYKMEIDLLLRMNTSKREIQEIREWMEPYKSQ